jgi:hypothetical protein
MVAMVALVGLAWPGPPCTALTVSANDRSPTVWGLWVGSPYDLHI